MNALAFNQDRCCHLVLCLRLIPFHWDFLTETGFRWQTFSAAGYGTFSDNIFGALGDFFVMESIMFRQPFKWEQHLLKCIYWMRLSSWTMPLIYRMKAGKCLVGTRQDRQREIMGNRERDRVWLKKGCGISLKLDCWSSFLWGFGKGIIQEFIKIQLIPRISDGATTFHPFIKQTIYHKSTQFTEWIQRH